MPPLRAVLVAALVYSASCAAGGSQAVPAAGQGHLAQQQRASAPAHGLQDLRVVAYVAGWSIPPVIHPEKLTHINFAFAHIDHDGKVAFENPNLASALKSLLALKKQNPQLKIIVSVGGWEAEGFSDAALTDTSRNIFTRSAIELLREHDARRDRSRLGVPGAGRRRNQVPDRGQAELHAVVEDAAHTAGRGERGAEPHRARPLHVDDRFGRPRIFRSHGDGEAPRLSRLDQHHELRLLQQPDIHDRASRGPVCIGVCRAYGSQRRLHRSGSTSLRAFRPTNSCSALPSTAAGLSG